MQPPLQLFCHHLRPLKRKSLLSPTWDQVRVTRWPLNPFDLWTADLLSLKGTRWTCTHFRTVRAKHTPAGTWLEDVKSSAEVESLEPWVHGARSWWHKSARFFSSPRGFSFKSYRGSLSSIENWSLVRPQMLWVALKLGDLFPSTLHLLSSSLLWSSTVCLCFHVKATSPSFLPVLSLFFLPSLWHTVKWCLADMLLFVLIQRCFMY